MGYSGTFSKTNQSNLDEAHEQKKKQRNKETNKTNKWTKNIFTNFDKMLLVKFILHPDFMALSLEFIACHAFSIAHPQCSKQAQYKKYFSLDKQHIYLLEKKSLLFLIFCQETWRRAHRGVHRSHTFDGKQDYARPFSCTFWSWVRQ